MSTPPPPPAATTDLIDFIDASPSPWHAVQTCRARLEAAGWTEVSESVADWSCEPGQKAFVVRSGSSIIAWRIGRKPPAEAGFRAIGAHTDSPNLRIKPCPDRVKEGHATLGVETYGGVLLATWADRDLSIAGRVTLRGAERKQAADQPAAPFALESRLLRIDRPLCRVPNLAIHLNRGVNKDGLVLNKQKHLPVLWGMADGDEAGAFKGFVADELSVDVERILGWDLCLFDTVPSTVSGRNNDFVHAPRLDNLGCCHSALAALIEADGVDGDDADGNTTRVVALFDNEEIGSRTTRGAAGSFLADVLMRLAGGPEALVRAKPQSFLVSADMAHGVHPNYADRHDGQHKPVLGGGPVLKTHSEWRYATDSESSALFRAICGDVGVTLQEYVNRTDLACGSTIGPIVTSSLGIAGVDVGNPMLSMHSIREMAHSDDQGQMITAMKAFFRWDGVLP